MSLSRENNTAPKGLESKHSNFERPSLKDLTNSNKRHIEEEPEEVSMKKRKLFDDKAPGLYDHLTKFVQEETSTEAASSHSPERDSDEHNKHTIHIPTPMKDGPQTETTSLSNAVKIVPFSKPVENFPLPSNVSEKVTTKTTSSGVSNFEVEEVQRQKILNMITFNTVMLNNIMSQQKNYQKSLCACIENFKSFKDEVSDGQKTQLEKIEQIKKDKNQSSAFDSNPTGSALFNHLFGSINDYRYELVLDNDIPAPIFRERNLVIKVKLINMKTKEIIKNENKILLHLSLQTWEIPSNPILRNKTGNKAIMGETEIELHEGVAAFDRIQINEVTSKFIHGYIAMLVIPTKPINYGTSLTDQGQGENYVQYEHIKPLMLEKIIVKSKKKNVQKKKAEQNE